MESRAYKLLKRRRQQHQQTMKANAVPRLGQTKYASPLRRFETQRSSYLGERGYEGYRESPRTFYRRSVGG